MGLQSSFLGPALHGKADTANVDLHQEHMSGVQPIFCLPYCVNQNLTFYWLEDSQVNNTFLCSHVCLDAKALSSM